MCGFVLLWSLRGLCGLCARVGLGGLKACGVFASIFILLPSFFIFFVLFLVLLLMCLPPFMLVVLLCSGCLSLSSCIVFVVSFSLTDYMQKKGRAVLVRPLCVGYCVVMRLPIVRRLPAIPFRLLRGSVRNCSNVGGSRQNRDSLMR